MNVSVVIPNHNGRKLLEKNVPQVIAACGSAQIIIVDDHSSDDSVSFLKKKYPKITLIEKDTNTGFATSVNLGVAASSGEIVVLLNTDVVPQKSFLKPLTAHFNDESVFAVGCLDRSHEKNEIVERGRGVGRFDRGFLVHSRGELGSESTLWVSGGSSAFRKKTWNLLGGMDELYSPFYWEDIDISYRALKSGYRVLFESKSVVDHYHEEGSIMEQHGQTHIQTISYRNQFIFVWKNITDISLLLNHFFWLPYDLLRSVIRSDFGFLRGFWGALLLVPKIIAHRHWQRKTFIKTDLAVINAHQN